MSNSKRYASTFSSEEALAYIRNGVFTPDEMLEWLRREPAPTDKAVQMTDWTTIFPDPPAARLEALPERSMGHLWGEDTHGRYCKACGRRWAEVIGVTRDDLTQPHFAHIGGVVEKEVEQAEAERDWLMQTIRDAASAGQGTE